MNKILIISDYFAPDNEIGAIRLTKISKYLSLSGFSVDVLKRGFSTRKEDILLKNDLKYINKIFEVNNSGFFRVLYKKLYTQNIDNRYNENEKKKTIIKSLKKVFILRQVKLFIFYVIGFLIDINYKNNAVKKTKINFTAYDLFLSSYGPLSNHSIGLFLKKKFKNVLWIADFRDPIRNDVYPDIIKYFFGLYEKKIINYADIITSVSPNFIYNPTHKLNVISNGYDLDDYNDHCDSLYGNDKFVFSYTGSLYNGKQDITVFFKILKELIEEKIIIEEDLEIIYAGKNANLFSDQYKNLLSDNIINNFGYVTRKESIDIQKKSNILILASWNEIDYQGHITGKLYEYLMSKKPILCIIEGTVPNSLLKEIISIAKIGCCYERANSQIDYFVLKEYIKNHYLIWKTKTNTDFLQNTEYINQFNYKNIVNQLINLIEKHIT